MELILIRHGTTQGNLERRFIGLTDIPVLPDGEELAREVSKALPPVDHVYHSPLIRCVQTARLLWPEVEMTAVEDLQETDFGPFEGKRHEELKDDPLYQKWLATNGFGEIPGVESVETAARRMARGIRWILADAAARGFSRVGVASHGGSLMVLMAAVGAPARPNANDWLCGNCGGWRVEAEAEPLRLTVLEELEGRK